MPIAGLILIGHGAVAQQPSGRALSIIEERFAMCTITEVRLLQLLSDASAKVAALEKALKDAEVNKQ